MTYRPDTNDDHDLKVVNISDQRNVQRICDLVNLAMLDAGVDLADDDRAALWTALAERYVESGYVLWRRA